MKLVWSPDLASKAYIDTVKYCQKRCRESSVAEIVSAMAAGWTAKLIVETWSKGGIITTSVGLAVAAHHSGGRHVCIVPDEESRKEYSETVTKTSGVQTEIIVGEPETLVAGLIGIDFLVVDCGKNDFARIFQVAKLGNRGAVLVSKNASSRAVTEFRWLSILDGESTRRIVRSVFLPVGKGLNIAHVSAVGEKSSAPAKGHSRWFKHIDRHTGEEIVIRM
ncbi:uncharacterized protein LOC124928817 [Impatiens glandulifera]|uniref:uncharacterized protein LOC124928817 n=1 Tax=Impatiens glandulifera TaxID=253017 RepID=UPI001FB0539A|nr:uncharacterized protein LOC124928817 [Impatiens glandulifera]